MYNNQNNKPYKIGIIGNRKSSQNIIITEDDIEFIDTDNIFSLLLNENLFNNRKRNSIFVPDGIFISDTYSYFTFPVKKIINDTYKFEFPQYVNEFEKNYFSYLLNDEYLPFHLYIEYLENQWVILLTRPFTIQPIIPAPNDNNKSTIDKLRNKIHIVILGRYDTQIFDKSLRNILINLIEEFYNYIKMVNYSAGINKSNVLFVPEHLYSKLSFLNTNGFQLNKI